MSLGLEWDREHKKVLLSVELGRNSGLKNTVKLKTF